MSATTASGSTRPNDRGAVHGRVYLVGAGPGDPDLLTLRAATLLRSCDIVFHDHLVAEAVLDHVGPEAVRIDVGKVGHGPSSAQAGIDGSLIRAAHARLRVLRLKGGDPYLYGRGGEEALALADAGVPFEVVPGVSALSAVPASAGIPLTHRGVATSVGVIAGACAGDGGVPAALGGAAQADTVVAFMGLANLGGLVQALLAAGRNADTPAAAIASGTTRVAATVIGTLGGIDADVRRAGLRAPVLIVVGDVVRLRERLAGGAASAAPNRERILQECMN